MIYYWTTTILLIVLLIGCEAMGDSASQATAPDSISQPNIIFILADDLGYGDVGCYGQEIIKTPHLDQLAAGGIRFTQFYAASTVCAPSRAGLVTGKHMGQAPIRGNGNLVLADNEVTFAEPLQQAGYRTAMIGKWGLGDDLARGPDTQGFDYYLGYLNQIHAHNYYPDYLLENGDSIRRPNEVKYMPKDHWTKGLGGYATKKVEYSNDLFTQKALNFIEQNQDTSFFLYLPYTIPHNNGEAPVGERQEVPDYGSYADQDWPQEQKGYAAMITRMDEYVGDIVTKLKQLDIDRRTLIVFTSDNGPMAEKEFCQFFDSNGVFRGGKRDLYEGGIRVPTIAYWPGVITPGVSDEPLASYDLLPTFNELTNAQYSGYTTGISFANLLKGQPQSPHKYMYWEYRNGRDNVVIKSYREGKWKLLAFEHFAGSTTYELYDLYGDKQEQDNLAATNEEMVTKLKNKIPQVRSQYPYDLTID